MTTAPFAIGERGFRLFPHLLERQLPQAQGSADHDNEESYYNDDDAEDYDIRVESGIRGRQLIVSV